MGKKKSFAVVARNERGRHIIGGNGTQVYDEGLANEIRAKHKKDLNVVEDPRHEWHLKNDRQTDGHNVSIHHYTFSGVDMKNRGGNERVKVKTEDGFTFMSREKAEELDLEIIEQKREKRRKGAEVKRVKKEE